MIGNVVDQVYEILDEIGTGSIGTVYKARDRQSGDIMALKVLNCSNAEQTALQRFMRSIEDTKVLSHPNVLAPVASGFVDDQPYVVTAYCDGRLLSDVLRREKRLPVARAVRIAAQICDALEHAHYYGVIHRNLKPENIMIIENRDGDETAKVLDFAVAKSFFQSSKKENVKVTVAGEVVGTPEFMSPEQCRFLEIDWRSDIYAVGCIMYAMITGRPPIRGSNRIETMLYQATQSPLPFGIAARDITVPSELQSVVMIALSKNPEERQQTMTQLKDELVQAAKNV